MAAKIFSDIKKRNGDVEKFDPEKIVRVVVAAGLDIKDAQALAQKVASWLAKKNEAIVTTIELREKIVEELKKVDDYASKKYIWWEGYKDKHFNK